MQEVIDELLKTEAEAQQVIARAQEEAKASKADLEAELSGKLNQVREDARRFVLSEMEKTRVAVRKEHEASLGEAQAKADALWRDNQEAIDRLTEEVIALILAPEYEKE